MQTWVGTTTACVSCRRRVSWLFDMNTNVSGICWRSCFCDVGPDSYTIQTWNFALHDVHILWQLVAAFLLMIIHQPKLVGVYVWSSDTWLDACALLSTHEMLCWYDLFWPTSDFASISEPIHNTDNRCNWKLAVWAQKMQHCSITWAAC